MNSTRDIREKSCAWRRRGMGCPWVLVQHILGMPQPQIPDWQLNKTDQGEHCGSCHGYQSLWTIFSDACFRGKLFHKNYKFSVRYKHRYSPELVFSVLSHPAAQRPQTAHANSHRCLHLHPGKPSSLMLISWDRQTFMLLDFTQIPACRNELEVELSKFSCWSWLQLCSAGKAGLGPASCSQPAKGDVVTSQVTRGDQLLRPSIPAQSSSFLRF